MQSGDTHTHVTMSSVLFSNIRGEEDVSVDVFLSIIFKCLTIALILMV